MAHDLQSEQGFGDLQSICGGAVQGSSMDAVVDKATLDCLMNCTNWEDQVGGMLRETVRVLKPGGK